MMKYLAVIFDLFGTLVNNFSSRGYNDTLTKMAKALSVPSDDFREAWLSTSKERNTGDLQNCEADLEYICRKLNISTHKEQIQLAVQVRLDYIWYVMMPQRGAVEILSHLKEDGYKIGLLSNCTHEIPVIWPKTSLAALVDVTVFSCSVGMRKPDPRIYQLIAGRLRVTPEECLYIGDGGSEELSGAFSAGMYPILFRPDAESPEKHLMDREQWNGLEISSLEEILITLRDEKPASY